MKRTLILLVLLAFCFVSTFQTSAVWAPSGESWQIHTTIDAEKILEEGCYSDTQETVTWEGMTFVTADLRRAVEELSQAQEARATVVTRGRYTYRLLSQNLFYSHGPQHVLGRITLNPGQSGSLGIGSTYSIETSVSAGVDLDLFELNISSGYSQSYTVSSSLNVENNTNYMRTAALSCVFMIHNYDVYDSSGAYVGRGQVYEPYSVFTYWVN